MIVMVVLMAAVSAECQAHGGKFFASLLRVLFALATLSSVLISHSREKSMENWQ